MNVFKERQSNTTTRTTTATTTTTISEKQNQQLQHYQTTTATATRNKNKKSISSLFFSYLVGGASPPTICFASLSFSPSLLWFLIARVVDLVHVVFLSSCPAFVIKTKPDFQIKNIAATPMIAKPMMDNKTTQSTHQITYDKPRQCGGPGTNSQIIWPQLAFGFFAQVGTCVWFIFFFSDLLVHLFLARPTPELHFKKHYKLVFLRLCCLKKHIIGA